MVPYFQIGYGVKDPEIKSEQGMIFGVKGPSGLNFSLGVESYWAWGIFRGLIQGKLQVWLDQRSGSNSLRFSQPFFPQGFGFVHSPSAMVLR